MNCLHKITKLSRVMLTKHNVTSSSLQPYLCRIGRNISASDLPGFAFTPTVFLFGRSSLNTARCSTRTSLPARTVESSSRESGWRKTQNKPVRLKHGITDAWVFLRKKCNVKTHKSKTFLHIHRVNVNKVGKVYSLEYINVRNLFLCHTVLNVVSFNVYNNN